MASDGRYAVSGRTLLATKDRNGSLARAILLTSALADRNALIFSYWSRAACEFMYERKSQASLGCLVFGFRLWPDPPDMLMKLWPLMPLPGDWAGMSAQPTSFVPPCIGYRPSELMTDS